jgi:hypothetical protein
MFRQLAEILASYIQSNAATVLGSILASDDTPKYM